MRPRARALTATAGLLVATALCVPLAGRAQDSSPGRCGPPDPGVKCAPGNGRKTTGGGAKAPHDDGAGHSWPAITGILWQAVDSGDRQKLGGPGNDELLGHHGNERLQGAGGDDVIWGDWDPHGNTTHQHDVLSGGSGNDWLYPSHGLVTVKSGPGRDYVYAYYGHGTIDCGPGQDVARVRLATSQYKIRNCETIKHFCAFGDNGRGGCFKPGENPKARRAR